MHAQTTEFFQLVVTLCFISACQCTCVPVRESCLRVSCAHSTVCCSGCPSRAGAVTHAAASGGILTGPTFMLAVPGAR